MYILKNSLYQSHELLSQIVTNGDIVVDATAGKGNDTAFLAGLIGDEGKVYSFDIQESALNITKDKLQDENLLSRVNLVHDGHQNMKKYINSPVKAVMFNLGYLPGGDHNIGTKGSSTVAAIQAAMDLLVVNGIISLVVYYGGDSGFEEKDEVLNYVQSIDCRSYSVLKTEFVNQINCPPMLICIEKIK